MRIAIVDDLAAERTLLKATGWSGSFSGETYRRIFWNTKAARYFWKRQGKRPLLPHFWIFIWMA